MYNPPMRQHYASVQLLRQDHTRLVRIGREIDQMRHHLRHLGTVQPTLGQHTADDGILISLGDVPARHDHIVEKQPRVGAVLSRVCELALRQGGLEPLRFDDGDQGVVRIVKGREVDCAGQEMGEIR